MSREDIQQFLSKYESEAHKLERMLVLQAGLQKMINGKPIDQFTDAERMEAIRVNVLACTDELHEALGETGWKPWATSNHINTESFHSELVDAFHFFMNLMLHSGMTAQQLFDGYVAKNRRNWERYKDGTYDGIKGKCPGCKRDYYDAGVECKPTPDGAEASGWCTVLDGWVDQNGKLY